MDGILLIDKPAGPTSHDIVKGARTILQEEKIGHAGTLDPAAEGLLVLAVGKALKIIQFMGEHDKVYDFTVRFGRVTDTDDATGRVLSEADATGLTREEVEKSLAPFRGEFEQRPPKFSAIKVGGRRMHEAARSGEELDAPARRVTVHELDLTEWNPPLASMTVHCSKGTYVRSLARDIGEALGVGGSVEGLSRTASGPFRREDGVPPGSAREEFEKALLPMDSGLMHLAEIRIATREGHRFSQGQFLERRIAKGVVRVYVGPRFIGVGESDGKTLRPRKVLEPPISQSAER